MTVAIQWRTKQNDPLCRWNIAKETIESLDSATVAHMRKIAGIRFLEPAEEQALALLAGQPGGDGAYEKLITHNLDIAVKAALFFKDHNVPLDDLISEGEVALSDAIKSFEPGRGLLLRHHIGRAVAAAVKRYIAEQWSIVVRPYEDYMHLTAFFSVMAKRDKALVEDDQEFLVDNGPCENEVSAMLALPDQQIGYPIRVSPKEIWVDQFPDQNDPLEEREFWD